MRDQLSRAFGKVPLQSSTGPVMLRPWLGEDSFDSSMASQAVPHVPHVVTGNSANSALSIDGVCTLPRVASIAFGESAAGRPTNEQTGTRSQTTDAPYASGLAHSEAVHCLSMKRPEDGGQAFSQIDIADEQDDQRTDCRYVTVESANLLSVTAQTARICRDCGKVIAPSLHSSPSTVLPRASVLLCLAFSLLVFQVIDAGGAHVVLAHQNPLSKTALSGRVAFLIGQSIGSFVGSSLHSMGRWALLVDLALGSLFAAIAGTSITYIMLDIFRGLTGVTSGIMLSLVLHDLRSLLASWVPTSMAALLVLLLAAVAQVCGGWLSPLIVHSLHWQWLYWGSSIALFCNTCATAFLVSLKRAQRSSSLQQAQNKRATVAFLKRSALVVWLPITHPHLSLATMSMAIAACIHVTVLATVHFLWKLTFRFSSHRAFLTTTVCLLISLLLALVIVAILGRKHPGKGGKRLTLYDEKSPQAAGCRGALPERALLQTAIALLVMAGGLLFMALATKTTVSWVATALLLVIIGTASLLTIDSGLRYILDIYRPTGDGQGDWGKHYVVAASGSCLGTVIGACAQALMMSPLGESTDVESQRFAAERQSPPQPQRVKALS